MSHNFRADCKYAVVYASVADPDPDPDPPDPHVFGPSEIYQNKDRAFWFPCLSSSLCLKSVRLLTPPPPPPHLPLAGSVTIYAKTTVLCS
jgi:hypothetical protein